MTLTVSTRPLILVGVDGSDEAAQAAVWAADYATRIGGTLEVFIAWHRPMSYVYPISDLELAARALVEKAAAEVSLPPERLRITVVAGSPKQELVAASARVDLLVVGSRGLGGFSGLLLGSVSAHCVHHAHCPVVVVRPFDIERLIERAYPCGD